MVYGDGSSPRDDRFRHIDQGGVFKYFLPDKLNRRKEKLFYALVKEAQTVAGIAELEKSPYRDNTYWISFLSVDPEFQGNGYSKQLLEEIFEFAKREGIDLQLSTLTNDGETKLRRNLEDLAEKHSIQFVEG